MSFMTFLGFNRAFTGAGTASGPGTGGQKVYPSLVIPDVTGAGTASVASATGAQMGHTSIHLASSDLIVAGTASGTGTGARVPSPPLAKSEVPAAVDKFLEWCRKEADFGGRQMWLAIAWQYHEYRLATGAAPLTANQLQRRLRELFPKDMIRIEESDRERVYAYRNRLRLMAQGWAVPSSLSRDPKVRVYDLPPALQPYYRKVAHLPDLRVLSKGRVITLGQSSRTRVALETHPTESNTALD
jgi:hypothetical protein